MTCYSGDKCAPRGLLFHRREACLNEHVLHPKMKLQHWNHALSCGDAKYHLLYKNIISNTIAM